MIDLLGVILSAGRSTRMGSPKALLPWRDGIFLAGCCRSLSHADLLSVVISDPALSASAPEGVQLIHNSDPDRGGPFRSLALALRAQPCRRALVLPVDCPRVSPETVALLLHDRNGTPPAVLPTFRGQPGHPVLLSGPAIERVLQLDERGEASTLRQVLAEQGALRVPVNDGSVLDNINTPSDLLGLRREQGDPL